MDPVTIAATAAQWYAGARAGAAAGQAILGGLRSTAQSLGYRDTRARAAHRRIRRRRQPNNSQRLTIKSWNSMPPSVQIRHSFRTSFPFGGEAKTSSTKIGDIYKSFNLNSFQDIYLQGTAQLPPGVTVFQGLYEHYTIHASRWHVRLVPNDASAATVTAAEFTALAVQSDYIVGSFQDMLGQAGTPLADPSTTLDEVGYFDENLQRFINQYVGRGTNNIEGDISNEFAQGLVTRIDVQKIVRTVTGIIGLNTGYALGGAAGGDAAFSGGRYRPFAEFSGYKKFRWQDANPRLLTATFENQENSPDPEFVYWAETGGPGGMFGNCSQNHFLTLQAYAEPTVTSSSSSDTPTVTWQPIPFCEGTIDIEYWVEYAVPRGLPNGGPEDDDA